MQKRNNRIFLTIRSNGTVSLREKSFPDYLGFVWTPPFYYSCAFVYLKSVFKVLLFFSKIGTHPVIFNNSVTLGRIKALMLDSFETNCALIARTCQDTAASVTETSRGFASRWGGKHATL